MDNERYVEGLRAEGEAYLRAGMIDRAAEVDAEMQRCGSSLPMPGDAPSPAKRQTRKSTQAAARRKK